LRAAVGSIDNVPDIALTSPREPLSPDFLRVAPPSSAVTELQKSAARFPTGRATMMDRTNANLPTPAAVVGAPPARERSSEAIRGCAPATLHPTKILPVPASRRPMATRVPSSDTDRNSQADRQNIRARPTPTWLSHPGSNRLA